jgi:hypothetical protein
MAKYLFVAPELAIRAANVCRRLGPAQNVCLLGKRLEQPQSDFSLV